MALKGWYGNRYKHSLASRGITSTELNRTRNRNIGFKDMRKYFDLKEWHDFGNTRTWEVERIIKNMKEYKNAEERVYEKISNGEIVYKLDLERYLVYLEKDGLIRPLVADLIYYDYQIRKKLKEQERRKSFSDIREEKILQSRYDDESVYEFNKRIRQSLIRDSESLFYKEDNEDFEVYGDNDYEE